MKNYLIMIFAVALLCACEKEDEFAPSSQNVLNKNAIKTSKSVEVTPITATLGGGSKIRWGYFNGSGKFNFITSDFRYDFLYEVGPAHIKNIKAEAKDLSTGAKETYTSANPTIDCCSTPNHQITNIPGYTITVEDDGLADFLWQNYNSNKSITLTMDVSEGTFSVGLPLLFTNWENYQTVVITGP